MAANLSKADGLTPIITFISMIVLGIIISEYVITEPRYKVIIILFSLFMGMFLAAMELRATIGKRRRESKKKKESKLTTAQKEQKLAKYVADLFEEDIEFSESDELLLDENKKPEETNL